MPKKIAIMGLENAGKSTIVKVLAGEIGETPSNPPNIPPTKKVSKKIIKNKDCVVWDFGGQKVFRDKYISEPNKYLVKITQFYYVIDVKDYNRLNSALVYFRAIFDLIKRFSPKAQIIFIFHKHDPEFDQSKRRIQKEFMEKTEPLLNKYNTSYRTYNTSIFELTSIKNAFS